MLLNALRSFVANDLNMTGFGDYSLNLSEITPRIIAMAFPAEGIEGMFRNSLDQIRNYLDVKCCGGSSYRVWNLSGRTYDYRKLSGDVIDFFFIDHHNPDLSQLIAIIQSIHDWLNTNPSHLAIIHCMVSF